MFTNAHPRQFLFLSLLLLATWFGVAQNYSPNDFKVALVGQFIKNIEWPSEQEGTAFTIAVLQDQEMMRVLSVLDGEAINGKPLKVQFASEVSQLSDAKIVYISSRITGNLDNVLALTRGSGALVVTENSPNLHNVMINIIDRSGSDDERYQLAFQINRPNILFENLTIKPDLILHGGTELDVASLYRETEQAMQALRSDNLDSLRQLEEKRSQLAQQQTALKTMEADYLELANQLRQSQALLRQQKADLAETTARLDQVNQDFQIAEREAGEKLRNAQAAVAEQVTILESLELQVMETNNLLQQRETELQIKESELQSKEIALQDASDALELKSVEVQQQAKVIDQQYVVIIGILLTLLIFTISTVVIIKMFLRNRSITRELESTVSTLKTAQQQLIETEKLASLGQLVAGVAHEINTPLGIVVTSSSIVGEEASSFLKKMHGNALKKSEMQRFLESLMETDLLIQNNLDKCVKLIQNFKQVSADQIVAENRDICLRDYIDEIMGTLSVFMERNDISWSLTGDNPTLNLDPGLLSQVINNLVNNAINHAFEGVPEPRILINIASSTGHHEIEFKDNGVGMDDQVKKKIFEPFFTTRRGNGGTGLGMNIVYNLITSKLHGSISVESAPNQGTTIKLVLPVTSQQGIG